jgi:hypothetical protein
MQLEADGNKEKEGHQYGNMERDKPSNIGGVSERANAIFELPSTRQTILYHHASAGFPVYAVLRVQMKRGGVRQKNNTRDRNSTDTGYNSFQNKS